MILGFGLGRLIQETLRRALEIDDGDSVLCERPITLGIMILTALILLVPLFQWVNARRVLAQPVEGGRGVFGRRRTVPQRSHRCRRLDRSSIDSGW